MTTVKVPLPLPVAVHNGQWYIKLNDGNEMPMVGLGTWQSDDKIVSKAVMTSVKSGYRLIDTARDYENEGPIGDALLKLLKDGEVKREEIFLTTKLHPSNMAEDEVVPCLKKQLSQLKLDYVDLFLIHWPMTFVNDGKRLLPINKETGRIEYDYSRHYTKTWRGMEQAVRLGLARSIGISNFNMRQVEDILLRCTIRPAVLQIESHPLLSNHELIEFCQARRIAITAYSPFGNPGSQLAPPKASTEKEWPNLLTDGRLKAIAGKYPGKSTANVMLRWQLQRGVCVIPKSAHEDRINSNFKVFDFELAQDDMEAIESMNQNLRTCPFAFAGNSSSRDYPFDEIRDSDPWESEEKKKSRATTPLTSNK